ncbi:MAG: hypothetical protein ACKOES_00345 [Planctomycetaceae bacterium]
MRFTTTPTGRRLACRCVIACLCVTAWGCGPRPPAVHPTAGRILFQGRPAAGFMVEFSSDVEPTKGLSANGLTDADGAFTLQTRFAGAALPGAVAGTHRVVVIPPPAASGDATEILPVPIRYADYQQSGLTAEVTAPGPNAFTYDLKP